MGNANDNRPIVKVVVVEGHPSVREGLAAYLDTLEDVTLIAEVANGSEALDLCLRHRPDAVLLDLLIPGTDGIAVVRALHEALPDVPVIAMMAWWQHALAESALEAGAVACLDKDVSGNELARAVRGAVGRHDGGSGAP